MFLFSSNLVRAVRAYQFLSLFCVFIFTSLLSACGGDSSGVTGMGGPGDKEGGNTLPPPPPLKVPAGEQ